MVAISPSEIASEGRFNRMPARAPARFFAQALHASAPGLH